jgi:hypothetical protein
VEVARRTEINREVSIQEANAVGLRHCVGTCLLSVTDVARKAEAPTLSHPFFRRPTRDCNLLWFFLGTEV